MDCEWVGNGLEQVGNTFTMILGWFVHMARMNLEWFGN